MKKKKYMVVGRTKDVVLNGFQTSQGLKEFGGKTAIYCDQDMASEIDTEHGLKGKGDVFVVEDDRVGTYVRDDGKEGEGVHHYFWGSSKKYREEWDKIFGKARRREGDNPSEVTNADTRC